ncbi:hypothetical protein B0H19DRAFT_1385014 [Mycena capillaripes]|nr:hypothetical protein B0H19DRAFT_1385014 [Mycena capillaripes]
MDPHTSELGGPTGVPSETDRLIHSLQACFSDLAKKQEAQSEKLYQAVEALKPKVPVTDKKTAFWNAYKTLADEHDKEIQQNHGTDLDTALIFAGLFSAVDSAFIIQIQPEIQPHGTRLFVLIAQNLLYLSLFSTLLAALLAVLGKQWLMHYLAAGERGTIEARGLERQRKFDGLRRWKFDAVMQLFPLLLQIGLFLFSAALSIYLWRVHLSLAIIVLSFTSFGFICYAVLLVSAVAVPDSPFQTPLAGLVGRLISTPSWMKRRLIFGNLLAHSRYLIHRLDITCSPYMPKSYNILPIFLRGQLPADPVKQAHAPGFFSDPFPEPSPEVPAVSWVLETSNDPHTIDVAAEMVMNLQWPETIDVRSQLTRLHDGLLQCFDYWRNNDGECYLIRDLDGMALRAIHLGRAYCALRWTSLSGKFEPLHQDFNYVHSEINMLVPELANVVRILAGNPDVICNSDASLATKWALQVIPSFPYPDLEAKHKALEYFLTQFDDPLPTLDRRSFTDYLFCVNSFVSTMSSRDISWMDKSPFQTRLLEHLFNTLLGHLKTKTISICTAAKIIEVTGKLAGKDGTDVWICNKTRQPMIHNFCGSLPQSDEWIDIVLATGFLTEKSYPGHPHCSDDPGWVHTALERVDISTEYQKWDGRTITGIAGLFNALLWYNSPPAKEHVYLILRALSSAGDISRLAAHLLLRDNVADWFQDDELRPILQNASVWSSLLNTTSNYWDLEKDFITMGYTLAGLPDWRPFIQKELSVWITKFFHGVLRDLVEPGGTRAIINSPRSGGIVKSVS